MLIVWGGFMGSCFIFIASTYAYYLKRYGHIDARKMFLPFKTRWNLSRYLQSIRLHFDSISDCSTPFDGDTMVGWATMFCCQVVNSSAYALIGISVTTFFFASGLFSKACAHNNRTIFAEISQLDPENTAIEVRLKWKNSLIEAINFHNSTKKYKVLWNFRNYIRLSIFQP